MIKSGRFGVYTEHGKGGTYKFTHRNPTTGEVWSDGISRYVNGDVVYGAWIDSKKVKWLQ